jgi:hypothetical protein
MSRPIRFVTVVGGLGTLCLLIAAPVQATHPRPAGATPLRVSLVPAYVQCGAPNRTHGPPLAFPSCNPPAQTSSFLTVGTPDANGASAGSIGSVLIRSTPNQCCPAQDATITGSISDVRCKPGATPCGSANAAGGPDYTGELQMNSTIRITDDYNATAPGGGTDPATVIDIPVPAKMSCTSTASTSIGATCSITTSAVAVGSPSTTVNRAVVEFAQIEVLDGGADGMLWSTPNTRFAVEGIFIP